MTAIAFLTLLTGLSAPLPQSSVPYKLIGPGIAKSPKLPHVMAIRDRKAAFEFFYLLRVPSPQLLALKTSMDWKQSMAVVIFPGYVPSDSSIAVGSVTRLNGVTTFSVQVKRGSSVEPHYPLVVLRVPRNEDGLALSLKE